MNPVLGVLREKVKLKLIEALDITDKRLNINYQSNLPTPRAIP